MFSFCQSVFHLLMRLYVLGDIALEVAATSSMNRPLGVLELRDDRLPPNQRYEELLRNLADVRHKRAVAAAELVARALKDVAAEQPNRAAPITEADMAVIDDEPEGDQDDPDLSEIFVANDATAEKILQQRREIMEEEQEKIAAELDISRDTYEGRLQTLEELSHRVETGQNPAAWLDIDANDDEEVSPNDEEAHEEPEDEDAPQGEEGSATVKGEPEPEAPSSPPAAKEGYFVSTQYLADQYPEYEYRMAEIDGAFQQVAQLGNKQIPLHFASGWELNGGHLFFAKPLKDWLTQLSKVVRQHDQFLGLEVDEDGYADLDEVARCFGLNHRSAPPLTVKDLIAIAAKDKKNRFEFLGIREGHKLEERGVALWPLKMRAAAGQSKHAIKSAQDNYRSAALMYCSPALRPEAKAPFIGKPIAKADEIPVLAYHRTRPACWKRIVKEGLIPGGGEFVGSDRAHVYLAANRITETDYQSGLRGKHPIQLTIALREAVDGGLIFFQNRSGGIMTVVDTVPPEYIIAVENTKSQSTLWTRVSAVRPSRGSTSGWK